MMTSRGGLKELTSVQPLLQASKEDAKGAAALTPRPHARVIAPAGLAVLPRELPEQADVVVAEVHDGLLGGGGEGVVLKGGEVALVCQEGRVEELRPADGLLDQRAEVRLVAGVDAEDADGAGSVVADGAARDSAAVQRLLSGLAREPGGNRCCTYYGACDPSSHCGLGSFVPQSW